jgi:hypothetical protein
MEIIDESKKLLATIEKIKETMNPKKEETHNLELFKGIELHRSPIGEKPENSKEILGKAIKTKKAVFRVSYLTTVIQFLDLKTILNISLVNRQFYHFIKSIYLLKIMNNVKQSKDRLKDRKVNSEQVNEEESSIFGKITGFLGKGIM